MERSHKKASRWVLFGAWLRLQLMMMPLFLSWRRQNKRDQAVSALHDTSKTVKRGLKRASQQAAATAAGAQQLSDSLQENQSAGDKVRGALHLPGSRKRSAMTRAQQNAQAAAQQASATAQQAGEQASAGARAAAARARELRERLTGGGQRAGQLTHRVSEEQLPMLRDVAMEAASAALNLWETARARAAETIEAAESGASHATHAIEAEAARAREAVEHSGDAVRGALGGGGDKVHDVTSTVSEKAAATRDKTQEATKQAATATVNTGRATGAFLFWSGAAVGLVFFALLDEERRNQLKSFVSTLVNQTRQLLQDIQGYDEEF